MHGNKLSGIALLVTTSLVVAGCGTSIEVSAPGQADGPVLAIGVAADEPGVSWYHGGTYQGFSVAIARAIAKELGYGNAQIVFKTVTAQNRATMLNHGDVEFVVGDDAGASNTVTYSTPYLMSAQGVLVREREHESWNSLNALNTHTVCTVQDSGVSEQVKTVAPQASVRERNTYEACVSSLLAGDSDAVVGPEPILYGLRKDAGTQYATMTSLTFGSASFSVGVRHDEDELVSTINHALHTLEQDGVWQQAADQLHDDVGFTADMRMNPPKARS